MQHEQCRDYVLVFDIETTGLHSTDTVTAVCALIHYIGDEGKPEERRYNIVELKDDPERQGAACAAVVAALEGAKYLVSYNGDRFDLPFLSRWAAQAGVQVQLQAWIGKSIDYYRLIVDNTGVHYKMQALCVDNKLECGKSASGLDAVRWARSGEWEKLMSYCMQDVRVLYELVLLSMQGALKVYLRPPQNSAYCSSSWKLLLGSDFSTIKFTSLRHDAGERLRPSMQCIMNMSESSDE